MKPNKIIEIQENNSEIRIRVKKMFKTYFSRFINEDVLFHRVVTCMDFGRGFAEDIVNKAIVTFRGLVLLRKETSETLFECTRKNDE